ncbi:pre-mRNA splicing factor [Gymnopus androsaceus JB14]|uniref:Pre-mRNA splicing factor n=1 Tax=Gymnopus androsaceus JB14 TaxID=1447944 RepID=A0A6A4HVP5_9AGAR|nr:pre-mRNA splicing factor [Gymnopus androsaceus JB14]
MSLVKDYSSDEDEAVASGDVFGLTSLPSAKKPRIEEAVKVAQFTAAPDVLSEDPLHQTSLVTRPTDTQMNVNIPYQDMMLPLQGPENPFGDRKRFINQNALAGHVEEQSMSEHAFRSQHLTHSILGYSANPSIDPNAPAVLGSLDSAQANGFSTIDTLRASRSQRKELKRKRKEKGDLDVVEGEGAYVGPWADWKGEEPENHFLTGVEAGDEEEEEEEEEEEVVKTRRAKPKRGAPGQENSIFHGKSMTDYQGRTYMSPPIAEAPNLLSEAGSQECFIPKVCIHTWTGHTQGVSVIRTFPETGHMFLSGSMDTKIKLWDIYTHGNCLRTFHGHVKAVQGSTTERSNYGTRKLANVSNGSGMERSLTSLRFHPDQDKQHIFLAGMSDKKIIQYDMNSGDITQEYDQHLGPVNTITFVDENRRFVTTSDDKTIRAWDFDIPVVIKYIAEPHMHSMPAVTLHPSKRYFAAQSLDNQILIYSTDNFRQNRGILADGKWISSGDGEGNVVFWDWKTGRIKSRLKAHSKVVITHEWLPHDTSKVITASWDGLIKLWD